MDKHITVALNNLLFQEVQKINDFLTKAIEKIQNADLKLEDCKFNAVLLLLWHTILLVICFMQPDIYQKNPTEEKW